MALAQKKQTALITPDPALVKARAEGYKIVDPLRSKVLSFGPLGQAGRILSATIKTAEDYTKADAMLGELRQARLAWSAKLEPIRSPIDRAMDELKKSLVGIKDLDKDVDGPLTDMENALKEGMRLFKMEEVRLLAAKKEEDEREARRLRDEEAALARKSEAAKTPQLKARLDAARAQTAAQASQVERESQETVPIRGTSSSARTQKKIRIADVPTFLASLKDYAPRAGVYQMGHPPLSLLTHKIHKAKQGGVELVENGSALEVVLTEIMKLYAIQPGVVKSWPGVAEYDDVTIAALGR